jgi:hypothetical protein
MPSDSHANNTVDRATLELLASAALAIPKRWPGGAMSAFLEQEFLAFEDVIARLSGRLGDLLKQRAYYRDDLAKSLVAVPDLVQRGRHDRAWTVFEDAVDEHAGTLRAMSLRHRLKIASSSSWYRLSSRSGVQGRKDMFHVPFEHAQNSYRFSPEGKPALYLGNNVYLCWLECRAPSREACRVSRFELMLDECEFLDIPINHESYLEPLQIEADMSKRTAGKWSALTLQNSPFYEDAVDELADYLSVWPLLAACSVQKHSEKQVEVIEYLIPQYLMRWVEKRNWFGIRYFTTRYGKAVRALNVPPPEVPLDSSSNSSDLSINVVIPARAVGQLKGHCGFLAQHALCTEPMRFADAAAISDAELFTKEAADKRQAATGRYMIDWEGGMRHYQDTPFGRMEYLLDRLPVARIGD